MATKQSDEHKREVQRARLARKENWQKAVNYLKAWEVELNEAKISAWIDERKKNRNAPRPKPVKLTGTRLERRWKDAQISTPTERLLMITILDFYNNREGYAYPSLQELIDQTGLSAWAIRNACQSLEVKGLLVRQMGAGARENRKGTRTRYLPMPAAIPATPRTSTPDSAQEAQADLNPQEEALSDPVATEAQPVNDPAPTAAPAASEDEPFLDEEPYEEEYDDAQVDVLAVWDTLSTTPPAPVEDSENPAAGVSAPAGSPAVPALGPSLDDWQAVDVDAGITGTGVFEGVDVPNVVLSHLSSDEVRAYIALNDDEKREFLERITMIALSADYDLPGTLAKARESSTTIYCHERMGAYLTGYALTYPRRVSKAQASSSPYGDIPADSAFEEIMGHTASVDPAEYGVSGTPFWE